MTAVEPFTFGVPLIARACAHEWARVEALLELTLTSVRAQTNPDFRIVIAGHDRPGSAGGDPRITFLEADWPVEAPGPDNVDSWRKKYAINQLVMERGGGLLMFLDADDWVDVALVEAARAMLGPDRIGAVIDAGVVTDFRSLRAAPLPHPLVFNGAFHRICGSSAIARLRPDASDPLRRDPWAVLDSHDQWVEVARRHGAELARLSVSGSYVVNTSENHSEIHGPHAAWRRRFAARIELAGHALDAGSAARFGLTLEQIRAASERFFPPVDSRTTRPRPAGRTPHDGAAPGAADGRDGAGVRLELAVERKPRRRIVLVATMRNEGPYILEWVAYHRAVGFTDIVICTNDCVDESPLLLERLQDLGCAIHVANRVGPGGEAQLLAYRRAEMLPVVRDADWLLVLDADEFLNIHVGAGTVPDLLDAVPEATAFLLNWRLFGNSGHARWRPGFVCERFTEAAALGDAVNLSFKTLFTKVDAYHCKLLPHGPGFADEARLGELHYVNGAGVALPRYFARSRGFLQSTPELVSWQLAQVNHYNTRSREDYLVKHHRGGGLNIPWDRDWGWATFNKNDETDLSVASKLPRMRALFEALLEDGELRWRHERCCALYREHIAALQRPQGCAAPAGGRLRRPRA